MMDQCLACSLVLLGLCHYMVHANPIVPETPQAGVRIFLPYENATLPNFAVIHAGQFDDVDRNPPDGILDPLWCQSANPADGIGVWYRAGDNRTLPTTPQDPLYVQYYPGQVGVYRTTGIGGFEGIYQCDMPDENSVTHTLYVGVYKTGTYDNLHFSGPMVDPSMQFSLVSPREADPPVFILSFNSTQGPPTEVNCTVDGDPVDVPAEDLSRVVHGFTIPSLVEVAVTFRQRRGGEYNCTVSLIGVNEDSKFFTISTNSSMLRVAVAETPAAVQARRTGIATIMVSWSAPSIPVAGHEVWTTISNGTAQTTLTQVTSQTSLSLANVSTALNYTFFIVAFGSGSVLPSPRSNTVEINYPVTMLVTLSDVASTLVTGSSYSVGCSVRVTVPVAHLRVTWRHANGTELLGTTLSTAAVNGTSAELMLELNGLLLSDAGVYTCAAIAEDDDGTSLTDNQTHIMSIQALQPVVTVTDSPTGIHIEGANLTLTCSTYIAEANLLDVTATWSSSSTSGDTVVQNTSRLSVTRAVEQTSGVFVSILSITPLAMVEDNHTAYTCTITVAGTSDTVLGSSANDSFTVTLEALPTPETLISANCLPLLGQEYAITCIAMVNRQVSAGLSLALVDLNNRSSGVSNTLTEMSSTSSASQATSILTVYFESLDSSARGNYTCVSNLNLPGVDRSTSSSAAHYLHPVTLRNPVIVITTDGVPIAGLNYSIVCRAVVDINLNTIPAVTWVSPDGKDLHTLSTSTLSVAYTQQGFATVATLHFHPLAHHDGGVYECVSRLLNTQETGLAGESRQSTPLTVRVPSPSVSISHDGAEPLYSGTSLVLTCVVTISNAVDMSAVLVNSSWSKGGHPLSDQGSRVVETPFLQLSGSNNTFVSSIHFNPLYDMADSGMYSCSVAVSPVTNYTEGTSANQSITISVQSLPDPVINITQNGTAIIGTIQTLHCLVDYVNNLISPPTITWSWETFYDSSDGSGAWVNSNDTIDGALLQFDPLTMTDRGLYWCNVSIEVPEINLYFYTSAQIYIDPQYCRNTTFFPTNATLVWNFNQSNEYNFTCQSNSLHNDSVVGYLQDEHSWTVASLSPYTSYTCDVTDLFQQDERTLTQCFFTTAQAAPGLVGSINITVASPMEVAVSWAPVAWEEANGDIQFYHVILSRYEGPELNRILVNASGILQTQFSGLEGLRAYVVSIAAQNGAPQIGEPRTVIFFTEEGTPPSPTDVSTQRLNGTHMNISWSSIPLTQSRGFIRNYTITYQRVSRTAKRQTQSVSVPSSESSVVIGGLDPASAYTVSVGATTAAGPGEVQNEISQPPSPSTAVFQLRGIRNISSLPVNRGGYFQFVRLAVASAINTNCGCDFLSSFITQEQLYCDQLCAVDFVYRATISSFGTYSTDQLLEYVEQWLVLEAVLTYGDSEIAFDPNCSLRIASYDEQPCTILVTTSLQLPSPTLTSPTQTPVTSVAIFVAIAVGCILLSVFLAICMLLVCLCVQRKTRKSRVKPIDDKQEQILLMEIDKSRRRSHRASNIYANPIVRTAFV